jgi:hypothetical protein
VSAAVCAFALLSAAPAWPADPADANVDAALAHIRPEAIRAHMRFLADDLLEGRGTGTRGYELAAKYVAARFEALGLAPGGTGDSYFQTVPMRRATTIASQSSLVLIRDGKRTEMKQGEDFLLSGSTLPLEDSQVTAPLVFAGFGLRAPELGYDDYAGLDVRGKIVLVLSGAPAKFPQDQRAYYSSTQLKTDEAFAQGAVAVLATAGPADAERMAVSTMKRYIETPSYQWVHADGVPDRTRPQARGYGMLSREVAASLFAGTSHSLDESMKTLDTGRPQSLELPAQASLRTVTEHERAESPNVAALLRGSDPRLRNEIIVLSAHLDHLGIGTPVDGDAIYNGAYDNASGIASLLEIANAMASLPTPPRRSILFLAVTAEEQGLQGSDYFVRNPTVSREQIVANINVDMFLMQHPLRDVIAFGAEHSSLGPLAEKAARRLDLMVTADPFPEEVVFIRSDQFSFIRQGIPALMLDSGVQSDDTAASTAAAMEWMKTTYHHPNDDMKQTFDFEAGAKFVRLNFLVSYLAAQEEQTPRWNPGDFFGERAKKIVEDTRRR